VYSLFDFQQVGIAATTTGALFDESLGSRGLKIVVFCEGDLYVGNQVPELITVSAFEFPDRFGQEVKKSFVGFPVSISFRRDEFGKEPALLKGNVLMKSIRYPWKKIPTADFVIAVAATGSFFKLL
jgi:hypothetical protein